MKIKVISGNTYFVRHWWRWYLVRPAKPWTRMSHLIAQGVSYELEYQRGKENRAQRVQTAENAIRREFPVD